MENKKTYKPIRKNSNKIVFNPPMKNQDIVSQEIHSNQKLNTVKNLSTMLLKNKNHQSGRMIDKLIK